MIPFVHKTEHEFNLISIMEIYPIATLIFLLFLFRDFC